MHPELPKVVYSRDIGGVLCQIPGHEEIDLLFHLTARNSSFEKLMRRHPDGKYRMLVMKESMTSHYRRKHGKKYGIKAPPTFVWHGWSLFSRAKDETFLETRWFQIGELNDYNLDTEPRDVQHEVRSVNWNKIPGGGLERPYSWDKSREDTAEQVIKDKLVKVY